MNKIHMMIGIQGSGKTTYSRNLSKELNIPIISSDGLRDERPDIDPTKIWPTLYDLCRDTLNKNSDFIFDATNITPFVRHKLWEELESRGIDNTKFEVIAYYFIPNLEISKERVIKRNEDPKERFLPVDVISDYLDKMVEPTLDEGFIKIIKINCYGVIEGEV